MAANERKETERQSSESQAKGQTLQKRRESGKSDLAARDPFAGFWGADPFNVMRRFEDQMSRWFGDFGFGRDLWSPRHGSQAGMSMWSPQIETFQRGDHFVVRADLPGLKKADINVEVTDEGITLQGERQAEHEEEREGYYRSERSYGSFYRMIHLPEGAIPESAKANFKDGVLEITVQAPPHEVSRGRRVEISEGSNTPHRDETSRGQEQSER
jgi:HSP20 family protein